MSRAVDKLAEDRPRDFLDFVTVNEDIDIMIVQRLLARGMTHIVGAYPDKSLDFLCANPRRLVLGPHSDVHRNTKELIRALVPYLDAKQFHHLEQVLLEWNRYSHFPDDDDARTRRERMHWTRQHSLRLLKTLPRERMTENCRQHIEEEGIKFYIFIFKILFS